jgi:hypothetical protein
MPENRESHKEGLRMEFVLAKKRAGYLVLGTPEADEAWLEVSKLAEILVSTHLLSGQEEFNTHRSALSAALHARAILRARELYRRYGEKMSMDERVVWDREFHRLLFEKARTDLPLEEFGSMMSRICTRESSADPDGWSSACPLWGQCLVISLLVQTVYGGDLLRQSLKGVEGFEHFGSHYSSRLPDGIELDPTAGILSDRLRTVPKDGYPREKALSRPDNQRGYLVLKEAFINELIKWMKDVYPEPQDD